MCVCDVSQYLTMADSKLFNCTQSPSHCLSHLLPPESTILVCILEDIAMPFSYAQTTFVNAPLFPVVFSVFCDQCLCIVSPIVQHLRCHLYINKEISLYLAGFPKSHLISQNTAMTCIETTN